MVKADKKQQKNAGMALAAKRGKISVDDLNNTARSLYDSMSEEELESMVRGERVEAHEHEESR